MSHDKKVAMARHLRAVSEATYAGLAARFDGLLTEEKTRRAAEPEILILLNQVEILKGLVALLDE